MARFDSAIALANKLILKNGIAATLRTFTDAAPPDPTKPHRPGAVTTTDQSVVVVFLPLGPDNRVDGTSDYVEDTHTHKEQNRVFMGTSGVTTAPTLKDKIIVGTKQWAIEAIRVLSPNGQDILYEILVRN